MARDPGSERARGGVERSLVNVAGVLARMKDWQGVLAASERQIELLEHDAHPASAATQVQLNNAHWRAAQAYAGLARWSEAQAQYQKALAILEDLKSRNKLPSASAGNLSILSANIAECQRHLRRSD